MKDKIIGFLGLIVVLISLILPIYFSVIFNNWAYMMSYLLMPIFIIIEFMILEFLLNLFKIL